MSKTTIIFIATRLTSLFPFLFLTNFFIYSLSFMNLDPIHFPSLGIHPMPWEPHSPKIKRNLKEKNEKQEKSCHRCCSETQ